MSKNQKISFRGTSIFIIILIAFIIGNLLTGCSKEAVQSDNAPPTAKTTTISTSTGSTITSTSSINTQSGKNEIEKFKGSTKESTTSVRSKIEQSTAKSGTAKDAFSALGKSLSVEDNKDELIKILEAEASAPGKTSDWDSGYDETFAPDPLDAIYTFFRLGNGKPLQEGLLTILRDGIRMDKCLQNGNTGRTFLCRWDDTEIITVQKFLQSPIFIRPGYAPKQYKNSNSGVTVLIEFSSGATIITMPR
ncbi:MAG: hypothetical protein PHH16_00540 [Candidatus Gracilibacteria bacterium]|nr:hypothetical protein [Candidatus Gracilibacteria bacterium]